MARRRLSTLVRLAVAVSAVVLCAAPSAHGATSDADGVPVLESAWPRDGVSLWVPLREARLTFTEKVNTVDLGVVLDEVGSDKALPQPSRVTKGTARNILVRMPYLEPGRYVLRWTLRGADGELRFEIQQPVQAPGGGNHRHGDSVAPYSLAQRLLPVLLVTALAFLVSARRRFVSALPAAAGAVVALVSAGVALRDAYNEAEDVQGWVAALADRSAWGFAATAALLVGALGVWGLSRQTKLLYASVSVAVYAGAGHVHTTIPSSWSTISVGVTLLVSVGAFAVLHSLTASSLGRRRPAEPDVMAVLADQELAPGTTRNRRWRLFGDEEQVNSTASNDEAASNTPAEQPEQGSDGVVRGVRAGIAARLRRLFAGHGEGDLAEELRVELEAGLGEHKPNQEAARHDATAQPDVDRAATLHVPPQHAAPGEGGDVTAELGSDTQAAAALRTRVLLALAAGTTSCLAVWVHARFHLPHGAFADQMQIRAGATAALVLAAGLLTGRPARRWGRVVVLVAATAAYVAFALLVQPSPITAGL